MRVLRTAAVGKAVGDGGEARRPACTPLENHHRFFGRCILSELSTERAGQLQEEIEDLII